MAMATLVVSVAAVVGVKAYNYYSLSPLMKANIEALTNNETSKQQYLVNDVTISKKEYHNHFKIGDLSYDYIEVYIFEESKCLGIGFTDCSKKAQTLVDIIHEETPVECPYDTDYECYINRHRI